MVPYSVWLLCVIVVITEVQGKSLPAKGLGQHLIKKHCGALKDDILNIVRVRRAAVVDNHWNKTTITYKLMDGSHKLKSLSKERAEVLVAKAFAEWAPYCGIHFREWNPSDGPRPDIMLSFETHNHGDGQSFDGPGSTLAHADYPYEGGSDVHFDDDETWVDRETSPAEEKRFISSFYPIALHEIGHALGLRHNDDENSIMYGYENSYVQSLSANDKNNMRELYGITEDFIEPDTPEEVPVPSDSTENTDDESESVADENSSTSQSDEATTGAETDTAYNNDVDTDADDYEMNPVDEDNEDDTTPTPPTAEPSKYDVDSEGNYTYYDVIPSMTADSNDTMETNTTKYDVTPTTEASTTSTSRSTSYVATTPNTAGHSKLPSHLQLYYFLVHKAGQNVFDSYKPMQTPLETNHPIFFSRDPIIPENQHNSVVLATNIYSV